jgi:hypothetical protein
MSPAGSNVGIPALFSRLLAILASQTSRFGGDEASLAPPSVSFPAYLLLSRFAADAEKGDATKVSGRS